MPSTLDDLSKIPYSPEERAETAKLGVSPELAEKARLDLESTGTPSTKARLSVQNRPNKATMHISTSLLPNNPIANPEKNKTDPELEVENNNPMEFIHPISTKEFELIHFLNNYEEFCEKKNLKNAEADLKYLLDKKIIVNRDDSNKQYFFEAFSNLMKLKKDRKNYLQPNVELRNLLINMPPTMYMRFRMYQTQQIKESLNDAHDKCNDFLQRLGLKPDPNNPLKFSSDTVLDEANKKIWKKQSLIKNKQEELEELNKNNIQSNHKEKIKKQQEIDALSKEIDELCTHPYHETIKDPKILARIKYHEDMFNLYKDIDIKEENGFKYSICHKTTDPNGAPKETKLSTMEIDPDNNTLTCSIAGGLSPEMQEQAARTQMDLLIRNRERSFDFKLTISGFKGNPSMALRLYSLAALEGSRPKIDHETIEAWEKKLKEATKKKEKLLKENPPDFQEIKKLEDTINMYDTALKYNLKFEEQMKNYDAANKRFSGHASGSNLLNNMYRSEKRTLKDWQKEKETILKEFKNLLEPGALNAVQQATSNQSNSLDDKQVSTTLPDSSKKKSLGH